MLRRSILATPLALAACNSAAPSSSLNIPLALQKVQAIDTALSDVLTQVSTMGIAGITSEALDAAQAALAGVKAVAQGLASITTVADAQALWPRIQSYVTAFAQVLVALPLLPPEIKVALVLATDLLPVVQAALAG